MSAIGRKQSLTPLPVNDRYWKSGHSRNVDKGETSDLPCFLVAFIMIDASGQHHLPIRRS